MRLNKKGLIRAGTVFFIVVALFLTILLSFSGSASIKETYEQGESLKLKLVEFQDPILKIKTPSQTLIERPDDLFYTLELLEIGNYVVDIKGINSSDRIEFTVIESSPIRTENETNEGENESEQLGESESLETGAEEGITESEIISIKQAEHLSSNKTFIEDVYDFVKIQDNIWKLIPQGNFIRIVFEKNLTSENDITIYARSNESGNETARVEVYEKDSDVKIADFGIISEEKWYKVLLTNLFNPQDTFDLKILDAGVEFDYIVDPWADTDWDKRKSITIDSDKVQSDLSDFPVLIDIYDEGLHDYTRSDGFDIFFTDSNDNQLPHEIELFDQTYNATHAHLIAWVKTDLSGSSDTVLWMYYNNSDASNQQSMNEVWTSNYVAVHHLNETSGNHQDSSPIGNDASATSVSTQGGLIGQIGRADDFNDLNTDYVTFTSTGMLMTAGTISVWGNMDASTGTRSYFFSHRTGSNNNRIYIYEQSGTLYVGFADVFTNSIAYTITPDTWHQYTLTWAGAAWSMYVDGEYQTGASSGSVSNIDAAFSIGSFLGTQEWFDGIIDELQVSNVTRTYAWVNTSYQNQNSPSGFYTLGTQETLPSDTSPTVTLSYPPANYINDTLEYVDITFNASVSDDNNLMNCSLWTNYSGTWSLNQTQTVTGTVNVTKFTINSLTNKTFIWNIHCYDNASQQSWASSNRTVVLNYTPTPPTAKLVQNTTGSATSGTTCTMSISAATAGNLLVTAIGSDKNAGTYTIPSGFTLINTISATSVSGAIAYKIATGGETSIQWDQSITTTSGISCWVGEYNETLTSNVLDVSAENETYALADSSRTSISTGTTSTTTQADELVIAFIASDTYGNTETGRSWSNDFSEIDYVTSGTYGAGLSVASKNINSIGTQYSTFSVSDTGDQMYAAIATFKVSSAPSDTSPTVTLSYPPANYINDTLEYVDITFNASVRDDNNLMNCSLWTNYSGTWSIYQTQSVTGTSDVAELTMNSISNKTFIWNYQCYDNASQYSWGSSNRTVRLNWTLPEIAKLGTDTSGTGTTSPLSFSHTLVAGTNRLVVVSIGIENGENYDISSVTYGGQAMNKAVDIATGDTGFIMVSEIWYILEEDLPGDGSNTVSIIGSGTPNEMEINAYCSEYENVAQEEPEATASNMTTTTTPATLVNVISPSANAWVISTMGGGNADNSFTHESPQVELIDFDDTSSQFAVAELRSANGQTTLSSTIGGTINRWTRIAASFAQYQGVSAGAPTINLIQCEESGSWKNCSEVDFGETLTRVRANCTDADGYITRANFSLTNVPDLENYFNSNASLISGDYWIYDNSDLVINESGQYNLLVSCEDNASSISQSTESWNVAWGNITVSLINPNSDSNVNPNEFFDFTARVNCVGGECDFMNTSIIHSYELGDGSDGALTVSSLNTVINNYTYLTGNELSGESAIVVNSASGFSVGDEILIIQMQNSSNGNAGTYEFARISSVAGTTLSLSSDLINSYYSGTFDSTSVTSTQVIRVPQYTNLTVSGGASIIASPWNGYTGGIVVFKAREKVTVTGLINVSGQGFRGGPRAVYPGDAYGYAGESYHGLGSNSARTANLGGGGGGESDQIGSGVSGASGGGGGYSTQGDNGDDSPEGQLGGLGGNAYGNSDLTRLLMGSGGGGGGSDNDPEGSPGGPAGGIVYVSANEIIVTGGIESDGSAGGDSGTQWAGSGGAGSGGSILLKADSLSIGSSLVNANGGEETCGYTSRCGGAGGEGRIRLDYNSLTGATNPSSENNTFGTTNILLSTVSGYVPFYTTSQNPVNYTNISCLINMKAGGTCDVAWTINATGAVGSVWDFYVNSTGLNDTTITGQSSVIQITIGNLPPSVPELNFPLNATAISSIGEFNWSNSTEPTGDNVYYALEISNTSDFSYIVYGNYSIPEQEDPTGVTPTGISEQGTYYWRVLASDLKANSSWSETRTFYYDLSTPVVYLVFPDDGATNTTSNTLGFQYNVSDTSGIENCSLIINGSINDSTTSVTKDTTLTFTVTLPNNFYSWSVNCTDDIGYTGSSETRTLNVSVLNNPPTAREIHCEESGSWKNCTEIGFGDNVTRVRVRCTDPEEGVTNATFNLTNLPDASNYFYSTTTYNSGDYWILNNTNKIINDSGNFRLSATCYDDESLFHTNLTTWLVPWGNLTIDLLDPSSDTYVMRNAFFDFTSRINCVGGECGNINVTLDPINWWDATWDSRKTINITNVGSTTLTDFPAYINVSYDSYMQSDYDDLRFTNGSCGSPGGVETDYEIENYTSSNAYIWVRIPSLPTGTTSICMYYNNSDAGSGENSEGVWRDNYLSVLHLSETGTGTRVDSANRNNASANGYDGDEATTGKVDGADEFDGSDDDLTMPTGIVSSASDFTFSTWINWDGPSSSTWERIFDFGTGTTANMFLTPYPGSVGPRFAITTTGNTGEQRINAPSALPTDEWHYIAITIDSSATTGTMYIDGSEVADNTGMTIDPTDLGSTNLNYIGDSQYGSDPNLDAIMDEIRISNTTRTEDWINQTYQLMLNQDTYVSSGTAQQRTKEIVSTLVGAEPFYTISQNPVNNTNITCLEDMKSGDTCNVTWIVNATGDLNSIWEFFVYANTMNYTSYFNESGESTHIDITIVSQLAPSVPELYLPLNASAFASVPELNWTNSTDVNDDAIYYALQVSNSSDFSFINFANYSIPETSNPTGVTPTGITEEGAYYWRVLASDLIANSSWSSTRVFYYDLSAPNITLINQTGEDNEIINDSHLLDQGENITFFVEVDDTSTNTVWIVIWDGVVGGVEKIKAFFTYVGGFLWMATVSTEDLWNSVYNYTIYANDTLGSQIDYNGTFSVLKGNTTINLNPSLIETVSNISVYGHVNLTNSTPLANYPINIWLNGTLLLLSDLTPLGTYDNYKIFNETSSSEFNKGTGYNVSLNPTNITLSSGTTYGNFTRILDAGAIVEWKNISWQDTTDSCSGVLSYKEGNSNNYSGTHDTYINSGSPSLNYGSSDGILVDGSPSIQRGLVKFEEVIGRAFNQVPENSTIDNANLTFVVSDVGNQVNVYEILENWTESQATYNNRLTGTSWSSTGCGGLPSRAINPEDSFAPSSTGTYSVNITNLMKRWINGTSNNYGVVLDMPTSNGINIRSSEYTTSYQRPLLMVDYGSDDCTNVIVYARTSNDKSTWTSWQQITNGNSFIGLGNTSRYLEYRLEFTSTNSQITPTLEEIAVNYTAVVTDSNGNYDYNFTSPSGYGDYEIVVNTSLRTIYINNSATLSVQTGVAPSLELISPDDNQWFSYGNLTLIYNVSDLNDDMINASLYINGIYNQSNSSNIINYQYNNFTINFTSGEYNWTVNVTDATELSASDTQRTFYIDLENPNVTLIYPYDGDTYLVNELNLSFNVTDNMDNNLTCEVVLDGSTLSSGVPASKNNVTNVSSGTLGSGMHYWNVTCTDNAIRNFTSPTLSFNITDTPPNVTLITPAPDYTDSDGNISFIYNASDNTGFVNCSLILNESYRTVNQSSIINYQENKIDIFNIPEGDHNWTVECFDLSLSTDKPSARNFSVDLNPPNVDLNLPSNDTTFSIEDINFNFTATDVIDSSLDCNLTINSVVEDTLSANSGELTNTLIEDLIDGVKYWNVTCEDDAGHSNSSVTRTTTIEKYPTIILNVQNESSFTQSSLDLNYTPSDNTNFSSCGLYLNSILNQTNSTNILNNQQNNFTVNGLADGTYFWFVNCTDTYGLENQSETRVFYIDNNPPQIDLHYPDGHDVYSANITFNFTIIDMIDSNLTCNLTIDSNIEKENFYADNGSVSNTTISEIEDGLHYWNLTCWDDSGNTNTSATLNFTKYSNPSVTLTSPDNNHWFNTSDFYLYYFPEDDIGIINASLYIDSIYNRSNSTPITNHAENNFSITGFGDGQYDWTVNVTDVSGLTAIDTERTFYVDTQIPNLILNSPNGSLTVETNNVTLNFTIYDNLAQNINCTVYVDDEMESSEIHSNNSEVIGYSILGDGNHSWNVGCFDQALNYNYSQTINFTVEAPPNVTLVYPENNHRRTNSSFIFVYLPEDPISIKNCSIYIDGNFNDSSSSIAENQNNNFPVEGIPEGFHNWTVGCFDSDDNYYQAPERNFIRDISPPSITLISPENDSGIDFNQGSIIFTWVSVDTLDNILQCDVTIDGTVRIDDKWTSSNATTSDSVSTGVLGQGWHVWNVTCWDQLGNTNTSANWYFNLTYPDFSVNTSEIYFNNTNPKENDSVLVTATIRNIADANTTNVLIRFYHENPDSGGTQIGSDAYLDLSEFDIENTSVTWTSDMGTSEIYVVIDPLDSFTELNEINNNASKNISVGAWHYFYGNITSSSIFKLADEGDEKVLSWSADYFDSGNVYVVDYDSSISWTDLVAIGKTTLGGDSSSDFTEIDSVLGMNTFSDSVYNTYTNSGTPKQEDTFVCFKQTISEVPVANSTNNTNFKTGILWDSSDDVGPDNEYDSTDKEELVFVAKVNKDTEGTYGTYDYELRVPAKLREYDTGNSNTATFYVEIS